MFPDVPGKPGKPQAADINKDVITIKWSPPLSNGGSAIIGYQVERREKLSGRWIQVNKDPVRVNKTLIF